MGGIDHEELARSRAWLKRSARGEDSRLPPFALMPTNVEQLSKVVKPSTPEFWQFFDSGPPEERDGVNYAARANVAFDLRWPVQRYY